MTVQIVARRASAQDPVTLRWSANGRLPFERRDREPPPTGYFAFRTTASAWRLEQVELLGCSAGAP